MADSTGGPQSVTESTLEALGESIMRPPSYNVRSSDFWRDKGDSLSLFDTRSERRQTNIIRADHDQCLGGKIDTLPLVS